jgi:hypothetical protein
MELCIQELRGNLHFKSSIVNNKDMDDYIKQLQTDNNIKTNKINELE